MLTPRDFHLSAPDGLKLFCREWGNAASPLLPVICLAGLTRHGEDFAIIAPRLAADGRRVIAIDSRGRGGSDYDPEWKNYDLQIELRDVVHCVKLLCIERAIFLGTSRGGLITALMALLHPGIVAGAALNDIGPVIEKAGLERIAGYVGKIPAPKTFGEAISTLKSLFGAQFPLESEESWLRFAKRSWREESGSLIPRYDRNIMKPLALIDFSKPLPDLWPAFDALNSAPVLVIRGELSDLLGASTVAQMLDRHPDSRAHVVPQQGHAPLLEDEPTITMVMNFLSHCDSKAGAENKKSRIWRFFSAIPAFLRANLARFVLAFRRR